MGNTGRKPTYPADLQPALIFCWAVLRGPDSKLLAASMPYLVPMLRAEKALDVTDEQAALLLRMSASTIDRRLGGERKKMVLRGHSHTKPGSLLKSQTPVRTWTEWDDAVPGFVEIDLVGHEGGNSRGEFFFTLTVTDISTGWTVNHSVRNKAQKYVFAALMHVMEFLPFPIIGIDSDNGSESINEELLRFCQEQQITFTLTRSGNKMMVRTWSRRTGRGSVSWSAISAMTAPKSSSCSIRFGSWTGSSRTTYCRSTSWYPRPAMVRRSRRSMTGRQHRISGRWRILRCGRYR